jgi:MOSC domain-containing protein YiiM
MSSLSSVVAIAGRGLQGDASLGRKRRQILLIEGETLDGFGLKPGDVRENLVVRDFSLNGLTNGAILRAGEVLLEITGDCSPCDRMESVRPGLQAELRGRRGLLAKAVTGGTIHVGDSVESVPPRPPAAAHPS